MARPILAAAAVLAGVMGPLAREDAAAEILFPAALEGQGAPGGGTYSSFGPTAVNTWGEVMFPATVSGGSAPGGLFLVSPLTGTRAIAMVGDPAPGISLPFPVPVSFMDFRGVAMDVEPMAALSTEVAFTAALELEGFPGSNYQAIYRDSGGALSLVAQSGGSAAGNEQFVAFGAPALLRGGEIAFSATVTSPVGATRSGVYHTVGGVTTRVAFEGEPAPDLPGWVYADFGDPALERWFDDELTVVFPADVEDASSPGPTLRGLFRVHEGVGSLIALEGDPAPGGGSYGSFVLESPAFIAQNVAYTDGDGLYLFPHPSEGPPTTLARAGDTPPGSVGGVYDGFPSSPCMFYTDTGPKILSAAEVSGGTTSGGLFLTAYNFGSTFPGVFARIGDAAPASAGGTYAAFPSRPSCALTSDFPFGYGSIAYTADLAGGGSSSGVFVFPEPGAPVCLFTGAALLAWLRARSLRVPT